MFGHSLWYENTIRLLLDKFFWLFILFWVQIVTLKFNEINFRYYEGGISSLYLWDVECGFAGVFLIKKAADAKLANGCWDSINVFEVGVSFVYNYIYFLLLFLVLNNFKIVKSYIFYLLLSYISLCH